MKLSNDLIVINKNQDYLVYNSEFNKALIINEITYHNLFCEDIKEFTGNQLAFLSKDEIEVMIKNGVLIRDEFEYEKHKFVEILNNRDTEVGIKVVYFHVTQRCNLKCSYCYNKENLNKKDLLSTSEVKEILFNLAEMGVKTINFTGGEILLRRDIVEICKHAKSLDLRTYILSNGMLLNERMELLNYVDNFIISLDTLNEKNNLRDGLNIPFLLKNLEDIPLEHKHKFSIRSVSSKSNENDWKDVEDYTRNILKMNHILVPFIPNKLEEMPYIPDLSCFPLDGEDCSLNSSLCGASFKIIAIDSDGTIYPCQTLINSKYRIANIKEENWLQKLKESSITSQFQRRTVLNIKGCETCSIKYLCGGGCSAISDNLFGDINVSNEVLCGFQKRIAMNKLENILVKYA
ncbi:radical SAM protein [Bacillus sp. Bva_UNVM-123]|uniref:radical SAM protein n=1 Tax=Bacillus sp. Bva_UNVM-123 TaxID=2829798 RepID=UPI00391EFF87